MRMVVADGPRMLPASPSLPIGCCFPRIRRGRAAAKLKCPLACKAGSGHSNFAATRRFRKTGVMESRFLGTSHLLGIATSASSIHDHREHELRTPGVKPSVKPDKNAKYGSGLERIWWARQDSNLQPDRYERPALTIELQAPFRGRTAFRLHEGIGFVTPPQPIEARHGAARADEVRAALERLEYGPNPVSTWCAG